MPDDTEAGHPRRSRVGTLLIALIPLVMLAVFYAVSPGARSGARSAISGIVDRVSSWSEEEIEPTETAALLEKATDLIWQERWAEAEAIYERLHEMHPDAVDVWFGLGLCRHHLGKYDEAIAAQLEASAEPSSIAAQALYHLAAGYARTGRTDEALATLEKALHQGYRNFTKIRTDPALESLREDERFQLPPAPGHHTYTTADGETIDYALVLPRGFDESQTYPALLAFTGAQQDRSLVDYGLDLFWGLQAHYRGWIVISPVSPGGYGYYGGDAYRRLPELLDDIRQRFRIEGDRFHVAGFSNGGTSAFMIATDFPEYFQSLTAFPVYDIAPDVKQRLGALHDIRVRLFLGENDGGHSDGATRKAQEWLTELGVDTTLTVIPGGRHVPHELMGDRLMAFLDTLRER